MVARQKNSTQSRDARNSAPRIRRGQTLLWLESASLATAVQGHFTSSIHFLDDTVQAGAFQSCGLYRIGRYGGSEVSRVGRAIYLPLSVSTDLQVRRMIASSRRAEKCQW